jgi:hypothetical protein
LKTLITPVLLQISSNGILMKKMDTKTANALAYVGTALLRTIEVSSLESRLAALEGRSRGLDTPISARVEE